ncbi:MAG: EAL domain-containing protein [Frankiales bacterium]|nr:MAG: EAL domain-containing protein [Frankiales bacterium]
MDLRRGARVALLVLLLLVFAGLMLTQALPGSVGQGVAWGVQSVTVVVAAVAMLRRAGSASGRLRQARRLIAASLIAGAAGGLTAILWLVVTGSAAPDPSIVDAVHFTFLPLCVLGLLRYPVSDTRAGSASRALLDGAVSAVALWFVAYTLILEPASVGAGLTLLPQLTVLGYPAADVFVLGMLASVLPRVSFRARRELVVTGSGLALYAVADVGYSVLSAAGTYRADSWVSVLYEAGLLLVAAGAWSRESSSATVDRWSGAVTGLQHVPVVAAVVVGASIAARGDGIDGAQLSAGVGLVAALFLRQLVSSRDRDVLTERLQAREELFRALVTGASDLITLHDTAGRVTWASPSVERILGAQQSELLGRSIGDVVHPDDRPALGAAFEGLLGRAGAELETMARVQDASGDWRWMQVRLVNQLDDPSVRGIVGNARDVHERHVLERRLAHAAFHDPLTGLGNLARTRALLERAHAGPREATVLLVDLDGFKAVNDTFGHAHGDALLCQVAERLTSCVRAGDEVTRIGGDEFVLVLDGPQDAAAVSARVLAVLREPVPVAGTTVSVRASLGVAVTAGADGPDEVLRNADLAMYVSKSAGRDRVTWYEPWMHSDAARRLAIHHGLRTALAEGQLALHYQPIVRLPDGALVGAEALLRWHHPLEGVVPPDDFIPVAEETGIINEIDVWVLEQACRDLSTWRAAGLDVPRVSINVSRRHMTPDLPDLVAAALARFALRGDQLCLEVTESAVVADADVAARALEGVRALGVAVALDDFGSGQSSLSQLVRLPVDSVKIDRSFTQSAMSDPAALRLLTSIVGVCQALALPVVAEGVEQAELAEFLAGIGCDRGQGFHFGRPQAPEDFRRRLVPPSLPAARTGTYDAPEGASGPR